MIMGKKRWHSVTRTLQQVDADKMRARSDNIPPKLDGCVLLLVKHGTEPVREYVYGDTDRLSAAGDLAGFTVSLMDEEPKLPDGINASAHPLVPFRARLNAKSNMEALRTDSQETRRSIEALMPEDSYVSLCVREQKYFEQKRITNWVNDERSFDDDSNPLRSAAVMCGRVSVGCVNRKLNRDLAVGVGRALCPLLSGMSYHDSHPKLGLFAATAAATLLTFIAGLVSPIPLRPAVVGAAAIIVFTLAITTLLHLVRVTMPTQVAGAVAGVVAYLLLLTQPIPLWATVIPLVLTVAAGIRWWRWTTWDDIMQRPRIYFALTKDRRADDSDTETRGGMKDYRRRVTGYGAQRTTLVLAPLVTTAMFTPMETGALKQQLHPVPEPLTHGGVYLGLDQTGRRAYIPLSELFGGIAISGAAGRGKSVLTHGIVEYGTSSRDSTDPKEWGPDTRIIDFEMKDDSGVRVLNEYRRRKFPYDPRNPKANPENRARQGRTVYLADPNSTRIDMLGMLDGLNAAETGHNVAAAMQRAFEPGDILNDSLDIIGTAMTIAVAVQRYCDAHPAKGDGENPVIRRMHELEQQYPGAGQAEAQKSPIGWCLMALAGSDGQAASARALGHVCRALALETKDTDMTLAAKAAEQLYGRPDDRGRRTSEKDIIARTNASRNKVRQFMDCEYVFTNRPRRTITWDMVLQHPGDYHFVLCDRQMPDGSFRRLPDRMNRILGKWMVYRLWNTVTRTCQNWREQGKHTMFVCDEVSLLADANDDILRAMKDQGRSFGWFNVFATQYPDQLSPLLLTSFMGYNTFVTFDNSDPDMAEKTARRLTSRDGEDGWDAAAVQNLPLYTAAVRTRANGQLQPAFIVNVENFDKV